MSYVQVCQKFFGAYDASSHVMQYGDLNMNKDCLLIYFGAHYANCINVNNPYCMSIKFAHLISLVLLVITLNIIWGFHKTYLELYERWCNCRKLFGVLRGIKCDVTWVSDKVVLKSGPNDKGGKKNKKLNWTKIK